MEMQVGQHEVLGVAGARERQRIGTGLETDNARFAAFHLREVHRRDVVAGSTDPVLQLGEILLVVGEGRGLGAGKPRSGRLGRVAGALDLARQRHHVRRKPRIDERLRIRMGLDLCQQGRQNAQTA